ncbi:type I restriction endonuclease subunit R [Sorangium sp. So ce117]
MTTPMNESVVEDAALAWLEDAGYVVVPSSALTPGDAGAERQRTDQVVLEGRLRDAVLRLNPGVPAEARDEAIRKVLDVSSPLLVDANHAAWHHLAHGVTVEYQGEDGSIGYAPVRLADFEDATENDWLATNQVTFSSGHHSRRVDVVLFLNGLPVVIVELKNAADEDATVLDAYRQLQTYQNELPDLFAYNALLAISDGFGARVGTLSSGFERFLLWRTIDGEDLAPATMTQLEVLIRGALAPRRLLDLIRHYTVFEDDGESVVKKVAGYHQVHAVERALEATLEASRPKGDRRVGVVWHTQGSGKSLTMAFYAGRLVVHPEMRNPTIVVITDRNDLDQQLFDTFARCKELIRQDPVQARDRPHLKELLDTGSGGVVFTTIQKLFPDQKGGEFPELTDRRNVVVISDEAHRSQYDFIDGFARHLHDALPNASFIGFTGTPIELGDKSTRAVFGDHISVYDIARAVEDGATVPIFYEARLVPLRIDASARPRLDDDFDEATEGEEIEGKEKLKTRWAALEVLVGTEERIERLAKDLVAHFEDRLSVMEGKAMVVCMSRRICVDLYEAIRKLRPDWHRDDDDAGAMKVVMTGSAADAAALQPHIRTKGRLKKLALRFKDPAHPFQMVIVRDMWLTGFDAPCLHTMYIDKPMRGHSLMQAIARVNRVFRDKPGGLVVDYQGIGAELKDALQTYRESGGQGDTAVTQATAVREALATYEVCVGLFHGFDWSGWARGEAAERMSLLAGGADHILGLEDGRERLLQAVSKLSRLFALAVPRPEVLAIRDDVGFFQAVRAGLVKSTVTERRSSGAMEHAIRQLVSKAIASDEVIDLLGAAGLKRRDISILSDEFLAELSALPQQNLAAELLRKLLDDEVKTTSRRNVVQARSFAKMLDEAISRYRSRAIGAREVIDALIEIAREMKAAKARDEAFGLSSDEVAFYDALADNESAREALGDDNLRFMARELVDLVKRNVTIDWTQKESVKAKLRVIVKRILRKHGYPPDKQEAATTTVLEQAELLSENWLDAS